MKKLFAAVALVAALFVAGKAQAQLSVNLGYAPETFKTTIGSNTTTENYQGFFGGVTYNIGLAKGLGVAPGAQLRMNMLSEETTVLGIVTSSKDTQILIDVPILLNYKIGINREFAITPFVGPMMSFAASGKTKLTVDNSSTTIDWYEDNSDFNRFNLYGVGGATFNYNQFKLFAGYRLGLLNQIKDDEITMKTQGFFVGLGYDF